MALYKAHSGDSNPDNMLRLPEVSMLEMGKARGPLNDYSVTVDKTALGSTQIDAISIGGTRYALDTAIDTSAADDAIKAAVLTQFGKAYEAFKTAQAGATPPVGVIITPDLDLEVTFDGNNMTVIQRASSFVLDSIEDGAAATTAFVATETPV